MKGKKEIQTDLMIIGAGMAGMSAAVFAANRGIQTHIAGGAGAFDYASGLLDLWAVIGDKYFPDPWKGLENIYEFWPDHPFLKIPARNIAGSFQELTKALDLNGLTYTGLDDSGTFTTTAIAKSSTRR